jgi:transposase
LKKNTEARRLDLLKHEGNGLLKSEIVKLLADKDGVSVRTVYNDFETIGDWQGNLLGLKS